MQWPSSCWRHAHKLFSFLRMHRNLVALQNLLLMSNKLFFFHFCLIYWGNLSVKYIECMFCWESVWENKSDLGFEQNLIPLGSSAQQRVFSQRAAAGRAAALSPLCHRLLQRSPPRAQALSKFPPAQASGTQGSLLLSLLHFPRLEGFLFFGFVSSRGQGRGCWQKGAGRFCMGRVGDRSCLVSLLGCIQVQLLLQSWKWIHKSQQAWEALDVLCFLVVKALLEEDWSNGSNAPGDRLLS